MCKTFEKEVDTMKRLDLRWMDNEDWYTYEDGDAVLKDTAPKEARESYERYLEQIRKNPDAV